MTGKLKKTPKSICIWVDDFIWLRIKMYAFNCGDGNKIKLKGNCKCQSKIFKTERKNLDCKEYKKECANCLIQSLNHKMYLQRVQELTDSSFDDKRRYESKPWIYYYLMVIKVKKR